jgi:toxin HigB-1
MFILTGPAGKMEIYFSKKKLKSQCSSIKEMTLTFGPKRARKLQARLAELEEAKSLEQISRVPPARCHELTGDRLGQLSIDLDHPYRLIFSPADSPIPKKEAGGLDWAKVTKVLLLEIVDTHE